MIKPSRFLPLSWRQYIGGFFYGFFPRKNWGDARAESSGYSSGIILEKVADAARKVSRGEAAYERDSITFEKKEPVWPILASLLYVASQNGGHLSLIDFGGSLGSLYFQHRDWLTSLKYVKWQVIEQENFVRLGQDEFSNSELCFTDNLNNSISNPDLILFSSSIQYLEEPYDLLAQAVEKEIPYIIFDRTPFTDYGQDIPCLQKVPPQVYNASYPCWFLSEPKLMAFLSAKYELISEFGSLGGQYNRHSIKGEFKGFLFGLKKV